MITFADTEDLDTDPFTDRIEELAHGTNEDMFLYDHYVHADGSHSFIFTDPESEHANPRHNDGNVATLVNLHRDYIDLDDADSGIEEARERWDWLQYNGHMHRSNRQPSAGIATERALVNFGDREALVRRYVAIFRDDILHYEDEWSVNGNSQSDWQNGYGFVTKDAWVKWMGEDYSGDVTPEQAFKQELDIYGQYFAGEVYGCIHVQRGERVYEIGTEGGYFTGGYEADEDACWGFLGYADHKQITEQFTDSPVVEVLA